MDLDVTEELARLVDADSITLRPEDITGDLDGGGRVLVCKGDLPQGCSIRGARALIVEGHVRGGLDALAEISCEGAVVILGGLSRTHVQADRLTVAQAVENALLQVASTIEIHGNVSNTQIRLGPPDRHVKDITEKFNWVQDLERVKNDLIEEVETARRSLSKLLQVTGVIFNLNLGKIVRQSDTGLQIDLSSFYEVLPGRSETEVDTALREFFAKAVLGMLTRLNRDYIASGRGHQERFKKVVLKLQDLVLKSREYDKSLNTCRIGREQISSFCKHYTIDRPKISISGMICGSFEVSIQGLQLTSDRDRPIAKDFRLQVEQGQRKGTLEARFFNGSKLKDVVFVSDGSVCNVWVGVVEDQIRWELRS